MLDIAGETEAYLSKLNARLSIHKKDCVCQDSNKNPEFGGRGVFVLDFMFPLTPQEYAILKSQIATSSWGGGGRMPLLSTVLRSGTAVAVSIEIMRALVRLRRMITDHGHLRRKLADLERKRVDHDEKFAIVFEAIEQLMREPDEPQKPRIGYETQAGPTEGE